MGGQQERLKNTLYHYISVEAYAPDRIGLMNSFAYKTDIVGAQRGDAAGRKLGHNSIQLRYS